MTKLARIEIRTEEAVERKGKSRSKARFLHFIKSKIADKNYRRQLERYEAEQNHPLGFEPALF